VVKIENPKTGKEYKLLGPDIAYVGPFVIKGFSIEGEVQGKWNMKLSSGEKFNTYRTISLYTELAKVLIRRALDKEAKEIESLECMI
jgi:hypothetical protein